LAGLGGLGGRREGREGEKVEVAGGKNGQIKGARGRNELYGLMGSSDTPSGMARLALFSKDRVPYAGRQKIS